MDADWIASLFVTTEYSRQFETGNPAIFSGMSGVELAELSGVHLRSIQLYEQRVNDIDKAQAATLYKLSRMLGCSIEDLLEAPQQ